MRHAATLLALGIASAAVTADAMKPQLTVMRISDRPTIEGPAANFTGNTKIDRQVRPEDPARPLGSMVSFEPGARTAWHTHPLGQTLIVTSGCGWIQVEGGRKEEIRAGDVIWTSPNAKHWHGAQPGSALSHYSIVEPLNGSSAQWMEKVSDEQYGPKDATTCKTPRT